MQPLMSIRALFVGLFLAFSLAVSAPIASAADPVIEAAKDAGTVGEQVDGYLGLVTGSAEPAVQRMVNEINAKRRGLYESKARETGATVAEVGIATGMKQIEKAPAGQFVMRANGQWARK